MKVLSYNKVRLFNTDEALSNTINLSKTGLGKLKEGTEIF